MSWSALELDIVRTLSCRVQVLSLELLTRGWSPEETPSSSCVVVTLNRLIRGGLIERYTANVHPFLSVNEPTLRWMPGDEVPDFKAASYRLKGRWGEAPEPTELFVASRLAANLFGSNSRRLPDPLHRDHDLLLGQVYVHYRLNYPNAAERWIGEALFPKAGHRIKDPDAFLMNDGVPYQIVESGGRYSQQQLESFHDYAQLHDLSYEIW